MNRTGRNGSRKRTSPYVTPISMVEALEPRTLLSGSQELGLAVEQFIDSHFGEHHDVSPTPVADLSGTTVAITAVAGVPFAGDVATLTSASSPVNLRNYRVSIDWGDGTGVTRGFPRVAADGIHVPGYHRYQTPGYFAVTVTLTQYAHGSPTGAPLEILSLASVTQNSPSGLNITANTGIPFTGAIGGFALPSAAPADAAVDSGTFKAFINWGDHAWPTPGTLTLGANGSYTIFSDHTYRSEGTYRISVFVMEKLAPAGTAAAPEAQAILNRVEQDWDQLAKNHTFVTSIFSTATVTDPPSP